MKILDIIGLAVALPLGFATISEAETLPLLIYGGSHAVDFGTQQLALGKKGTFEVNPLTREPILSSAIHLSTLGVELFLDKKLDKKKRWALRGVVFLLHSYGTYKNLRAFQGK